MQEQGRISNADLADSINLSQSACYRRVQRLEDDGIVKEYVALLDAKKMGVPTTVFVEITLSAQADEVLDAFEKEVARIPNVLECHLTAGTCTNSSAIFGKTTGRGADAVVFCVENCV